MQQQCAHVYNDPKYMCCCNTIHVEKGACIVAVLGAIISGCAALNNFIYIRDYPMAAFNLILLLTFLSIILAQKKRDPSLYLPYLIINAIGFIVTVFFLIFLIIMFIMKPAFYVSPDDYDPTAKQMHKVHLHDGSRTDGPDVTYKKANILLGTSFLTVLLVLAIQIWFYSIILRAYRYMKDEQTLRRSPPTPM